MSVIPASGQVRADPSDAAGESASDVAGDARRCYCWPPEGAEETGENVMRRALLAAAAGLIALSLPAAGQDTGRYQAQPTGDGFIRLDTRTGATSHCTREDGVWRCRPVIEEAGPLSARIDALAEDVAAVTARVDALSGTAGAPPEPAGDRGFFVAAMERLMELVRTLKHGRAA
jgi:hypothetical protein